MRWFTVRVGIRISKWAHLFATTWSSPKDGAPEAACGVRPSDAVDGNPEVRFHPARPEDARCPECEEKAA